MHELEVAEKQANASFIIAEKEFWNKVKEFPLYKLPSDLRRPIKAAKILSGVLKRASSLAFVNSRLELKLEKCNICHETGRELFKLKCGHTPYCNICINSLRQTCPACRAGITPIENVSLTLFRPKIFTQ